MPQDRFSDNNPYLQTQQTLTAVNNDTEFHVALTEADQLRATALNITNPNVARLPATPFPTTSTVGQNTISAALAGVDQPPVPPADNPVNPCFVYDTPILMGDGTQKAIGDIQLGEWVKAFDKLGNLIGARVIGRWDHLVNEVYIVTFDDGRETITTPTHRYWVGDEHFEPIFNIGYVWHWKDKWVKSKIVDGQVLIQETTVYNLTVEIFHNYIANGDAVSNLKPDPGEFIV